MEFTRIGQGLAMICLGLVTLFPLNWGILAPNSLPHCYRIKEQTNFRNRECHTIQETRLSLQQQLDQLAAQHEAMSPSPIEVEPPQMHPPEDPLRAAEVEDIAIEWVNREPPTGALVKRPA